MDAAKATIIAKSRNPGSMMQSCPAWKTQNTEPKSLPERQITGHEVYGLKTTVESG
jgi:hypothetical protein